MSPSSRDIRLKSTRRRNGGRRTTITAATKLIGVGGGPGRAFMRWGYLRIRSASPAFRASACSIPGGSAEPFLNALSPARSSGT